MTSESIEAASRALNEEIAITAAEWADLAAEDKRLGDEISRLTAQRASLRKGLGAHISETGEGISVEGLGTLDWHSKRRRWRWDVRELFERYPTEARILLESRGLDVDDKVAEALFSKGQLVIPKEIRHEETTRELRWR